MKLLLLLGLFLLPFSILAQDDETSSQPASASSRQTASAEQRTTTFTSRSVFETTLSNGQVSTITSATVVTTALGNGDDNEQTSQTPSSTRSTPQPTAPTDVNGGGGSKGAPLPGQADVGGAYGPDDDYIAAATKTTLAVSLVGAAIGAALVLL